MCCNAIHPETGLNCTIESPLHEGDCLHTEYGPRGEHLWSVRWTRRWVGDYLQSPDEDALLPI